MERLQLDDRENLVGRREEWLTRWETAITLDPGQTSLPFESPSGIMVIYCNEHLRDLVLPLSRVINDVYKRLLTTRFTEWIELLKDEAQIKQNVKVMNLLLT